MQAKPDKRGMGDGKQSKGRALACGFRFNWLLAACLVFAACRNQQPAAGNKTPALPGSGQPIEQVITLDDSRLGVSTLADSLNVPWEITWGPDNHIWCTEQDGTISKINPETGARKVLVKIPDVYRKRLGLLPMALSPDMKKRPYVFVNYTCLKKTSPEKDSIFSRLVRYTYTGETLTKPVLLLEYPAFYGHMGSRLAFAPDGKLMWATGDGQNARDAQDLESWKGKVLRLNPDGSIPRDNPIKGSPVWASGFRVPQGMVYHPNGTLYTAEHGDATDDEVNIIRKEGNYGWPEVQGFVNLPKEKAYPGAAGISPPLKAWTPTIAPAGMDHYPHSLIPELENALLLTTLKENDLRVLKLNPAGTAVVSERILLNQQYGRLRDVCVSPAGDIYVSTSNRDWNPSPGFPRPQDDRILRIFKLRNQDQVAGTTAPQQAAGPGASAKPAPAAALPEGQVLYQQYCASCHKADGKGLAGTFPSLSGSELVSGDIPDLIQTVLQGSSAIRKPRRYEQQMPAFHFLADQQVAALLTYIRSGFGTSAGPVTAAQVAQVRDAK
ncbi:MAG: PQQ-dependent sugar dehydrogenase [Adhaeribacter sp.]